MNQDRFVYGAATSAHQVEGNNLHNDWWDWEKRTAGIEPSGRAADHYVRFDDDFTLAASLGHTAHRLSFEWSRLEVQPGRWNDHAFQHYREVLLSLRRHGLQSFVTLHHFTNPRWLADRGGWEHRDTPRLFARYADAVAERLGDLVDVWITINEPMVYATQSYWRAKWPPGADERRASLAHSGGPPQKKSLGSLLRIIRNLANGHEQAYHAIHKVLPGARVGVAKHVIAYLPHQQSCLDTTAARWADWWFNQRFIQKTRGTHDFIGVNFYFTDELHVVGFPPRVTHVPWKGPTSDMGWPIRPEGLTQALLSMKRYGLPLYVTENGLADAADSRRADFIRDHLRALEAAQRQEVDVRGYLHWSLLDNFEWAEGFTPRFGLVAVDYDTMEREVRSSARVYQAIIEQAR